MNKTIYKVNGKEVTQKEFAKTKKKDWLKPPMVNLAITQAHPLESVGASCHPDQVNELNSFYKKRGIVGAYHKKDGTAVFESRKARNQVLKLSNMRDNDAGYGDYNGK